MIALDTNVLVRLVTRDDPKQADLARQVMESDRSWVSKTVLLELEWVLRYSYGLPRETIARVVTSLLGNRAIEIEDRSAVVHALRWYTGGLDFADALHLSSSRSAERFATFDQRLAGTAKALVVEPQVELLR